MKNPLSVKYSEKVNRALVEQSLSGDKLALNNLIKLHQSFIYNVAWKMAHDPNDALDLTQETLIKVITKLSQFNFKSSFRTWLYRIVVNEFLQSKRRKGEEQFSSFEEYGERLEAIPNPSLTKEEEIEYEELSKEMQIRCMSGMLMCLTREQRLIFILGDTFGVDHKLGAELFDVSPQNFRVKLHRARRDLFNYMTDKCGLVNKANPCRCPKKAKALKKMGMLDEQNMIFNIATKTRIADFVEAEYETLHDIVDEKYLFLFRQHPTRENFDKQMIIDEVLQDEELMRRFNFN
ncbi:MAG: RNA polymerase sigma factor [Saprospiraceae bacterium]|nr:RNA polymerase sigma factor [Saprospiraceae bacterium]